jgi:hypothetical protein
MSWRRQSAYPMDDDWVFASPTMGGKQPINLRIGCISIIIHANKRALYFRFSCITLIEAGRY